MVDKFFDEYDTISVYNNFFKRIAVIFLILIFTLLPTYIFILITYKKIILLPVLFIIECMILMITVGLFFLSIPKKKFNISNLFYAIFHKNELRNILYQEELINVEKLLKKYNFFSLEKIDVLITVCNKFETHKTKKKLSFGEIITIFLTLSIFYFTSELDPKITLIIVFGIVVLIFFMSALNEILEIIKDLYNDIRNNNTDYTTLNEILCEIKIREFLN